MDSASLTVSTNDLVGKIEAETTGWYKSFDDVVKALKSENPSTFKE